ncbi:hypothetical protein ACVGOW_09335 [Pseudonocardia saturnea]
MDGFLFTGIDDHIAWVDEHVTAALRRVAQAGRPLDLDAYGLIGQVFAGSAAQAAAAGAEAVGRLAVAADGFARDLRLTHDGYREAERANLDLLGGVP